MPEAHEGTVLDISYHGVLADVAQQLMPHSEIKLELSLPLIGCRATDIYAKVIETQPCENRYWSRLEFTSVSAEDSTNIKRFIHLLLQGG
jgi:adenylate cyclase